MDITTDGNKYGLEVPALTSIIQKMRAEGHTPARLNEFQAVLQKNAELIKSLDAFLLRNGAIDVLGNFTGIGLIGFEFKPDSRCGITFYGSDALAQKVADAFPAYNVIAAHDGTVFVPSKSPAKPARSNKSGPRP